MLVFKLITCSVAKVHVSQSAVSTKCLSQCYKAINEKEIIACEYKGIIIKWVMFYYVSCILYPSNILMSLSFMLIVSEFFSVPENFGLLASCCRYLQLKVKAGKTHLWMYV